MKPLHTHLSIGFLVIAIVFATLHTLDISIIASLSGASITEDIKDRKPHTYIDYDLNRKNSRQRPQTEKPSPSETKEFLNHCIINDYSIRETTLKDAIKSLNIKIHEQSSDRLRKPRILLTKDVTYTSYSNNPDVVAAHHGDTLIKNIQLSRTPASEVLNQICMATNCSYFIYKGDAYVTTSLPGLASFFFGKDEILNDVKLSNVHITQLGKTLTNIIEDHEYFGHKPLIRVVMSSRTQAALKQGLVELPSIDLHLKNTTLDVVIETICNQSNGTFLKSHVVNEIVFNPLDSDKAQDIDQILSNPHTYNRRILIPLDENWDKPENIPTPQSR